jgi:hypothetical protein
MADKKISQLTLASTPLAGTEVLPIVQSGVTVKVPVSDLTAGRTVSAANYAMTSTSFAVTIGSNAYFAQSAVTPHIAGNAGSMGFGVKDGGNETGVFVTNTFNGTYSSQEVELRTAEGGVSISTTRLRATKAGNVEFNTGNLIQGTAAKGVNFTANTPAAGMTSQLLNWYEEGTWTPADASPAGLTFTSPLGSYTRIGRMVFAQMLVIYPTTADTNSARIGGLPFTVADTNGVFSPSRGGAIVTFSDAGISMYGNLSQGTTEFYLFNQATTANVTNANLSGKVIRMTFAYPV